MNVISLPNYYCALCQKKYELGDFGHFTHPRHEESDKFICSNITLEFWVDTYKHQVIV